MSTVRRVAKNSGASLLAQISTPVCSFFLVFFIARFLGVSGMGKFSASLSLLYIIQAFSSLGFDYLITREVAQNKSKASEYLVNASFIAFIVSALMAVVMCVTINLITDVADIIKASYILSISLIPYSLQVVAGATCKAFEKIEYNAISLVSGNVFKVLLGLLVLFKGDGLIALMVVILGGYILTFCINFYFALKCIPEKYFRIDYKFCKWIIRAAPVFALIFIANTVRWNVDNLILTNLLGEIEVGFYSAAYKLMNIGKLGISCYIVAIQPVVFRLFKSSAKKYKMVCEDSIRYLLILSIPIAVGTTLLSNSFVSLIFGSDFLPAANVLRIIIWILTFSGANLIFANALVASNNQRINLQANLLSLVANVWLNLVLIPRFSIIGASIASISSSFLLLAYQYFFISKHLFALNFFKLVKKPLMASIFMGVVTLLLKDTNLFFIISVPVLVYTISLFALNTFSEEDKVIFRKLFKSERESQA
jgi:O-antigen/teichoic acid export membrane protein